MINSSDTFSVSYLYIFIKFKSTLITDKVISHRRWCAPNHRQHDCLCGNLFRLTTKKTSSSERASNMDCVSMSWYHHERWALIGGPGPLFTKRTTFYRKISCREIVCYNDRIALKVDRHFGTTASEVAVKFRSDLKVLNRYIAASRLHEILRDSKAARIIILHSK